MASNPTGTTTDEERLVALQVGEDGFFVDVTGLVQAADGPEEGTCGWRVREAGAVPRLTLAPVADAGEAGALPTRELSSDGESVTVAVPESLLEGGLGLDVAAYDDDDPLLFEPRELDDVAVGMEPDDVADAAIELLPRRFADGTPYRDEPVDEAAFDSDPIAEGELARSGDDGTPRSEAISAPVDAPIVESVLDDADVAREAVVDALETIERRNLVGEEDDDSPYDPIAADDRVLVALDEETWTDAVVPELDADDRVVSAVRAIHARQADDLTGGDEDVEERFDDRVPVVVGRRREYERGSDPPWKPE